MKSAGVSSSIVQVLREYNKALSIDFVAYVIGRRVDEIQPDVEKLIAGGAINRIENMIELRQKLTKDTFLPPIKK